ncbi:MAG: hypothetical protein IMHGJWDQ_001060 [Candidatus Fervidibacter sp.]
MRHDAFGAGGLAESARALGRPSPPDICLVWGVTLLQVVWTLFGWLALLVYLLIAGVVLYTLWHPKQKVVPPLLPLTVLALSCHLLYLTEGAITGWLRLDTPEAVAVVLGWFIGAGAFWLWRWRGMEAPLGFLLPLPALFLAFALIEKPTYLSPELRRDLLLLHVTLMMGGYLMLMLAFGASVVHLLTLWSLKSKRSLTILHRLPPLEVTERLTTRWVLIGLLLMTLGMLVGILWARWTGKVAWSDPKVLFSFLTGGIFAAYLHARFVRRWEAVALHWLIVVGFLCLLVTFLIVRHTLATG